MSRFAMVVASCIAGVACESSSSARPDPAPTFTGFWEGRGVMLIAPSSNAVADVPVLPQEPMQATYGVVWLTPGDSGDYKIGGFFPSEVEPALMNDGSSLSGRNISTQPVAALQCPQDAGCPSPTDSITVYEGSARIENGRLLLVLYGERNLCCTKDHFVAHFIGRPSKPPGAQ